MSSEDIILKSSAAADHAETTPQPCEPQAVNLETFPKKRRFQPGMTFLEIIIVVAIIAGLLAIAGPSVIEIFGGAQVDQAKIQMRTLQQSLDLYRLDTGAYPSEEQGLAALLAKPELGRIPKNWKGPYLRSNELPQDPWENDYVYSTEGSSYVIMSMGADGVLGGDGDDADISTKDF